MSSDVLVSHAREAARSSDWSSLSHYLRRISRQETFPATSTEGLTQGSERSPLTAPASEPVESASEVISLALYALQFADFQTRWDIAKLIPSFGVGAIAPLSQLIDSATEEEDWDLLWFVARILGEFRTIETVQILRHLMVYVEQPDLVGIVIQALANIGELAIPALNQLLQNQDTRWAAVQSLAQMNHQGATEVLLQVCHDANPEIRALTISAIGHIHDPQIRQILKQSLADPFAQVRQAAVQGLGLQVTHIDEQEFLAQIHPLLWDININVRRQTVQMLGRLHSAAAAAELSEALNSTDTPDILKPDIVHALIWTETEAALLHLQHFVQKIWVSQQLSSSPSSEALTELQQAQQQARLKSSLLCGEIAMTLGQVRSFSLKPLAAHILTQVLEHCTSSEEDAGLRQKIAFSLGQLALPVAIAPLTQLLNDSDPRVRLHAAAALKTS